MYYLLDEIKLFSFSSISYFLFQLMSLNIFLTSYFFCRFLANVNLTYEIIFYIIFIFMSYLYKYTYINWFNRFNDSTINYQNWISPVQFFYRKIIEFGEIFISKYWLCRKEVKPVVCLKNKKKYQIINRKKTVKLKKI